uniref:Uncharacterized protein n=1 Tax=Cacopsylla melanoneura TaxID=428564 RepID=A0A8D9ER25_9HEMI
MFQNTSSFAQFIKFDLATGTWSSPELKSSAQFKLKILTSIIILFLLLSNFFFCYFIFFFFCNMKTCLFAHEMLGRTLETEPPTFLNYKLHSSQPHCCKL